MSRVGFSVWSLCFSQDTDRVQSAWRLEFLSKENSTLVDKQWQKMLNPFRQRSSEYEYLRLPVISAFHTLGTRGDSSHFIFYYPGDS